MVSSDTAQLAVTDRDTDEVGFNSRPSRSSVVPFINTNSVNEVVVFFNSPYLSINTNRDIDNSFIKSNVFNSIASWVLSVYTSTSGRSGIAVHNPNLTILTTTDVSEH
jgi:hypothetical protein